MGKDEWGVDNFGPERIMLARLLVGHADKQTLKFFMHESAEADMILERGGALLHGEQYLNLQRQVHNELIANGVHAGYTLPVRLIYSTQSFPDYE